MGGYGAASEDEGLSALFDSSPDLGIHTSAAAEGGFVLGLLALLAAPFSIMIGLSVVTGVVAAVLALVGTATTSRSTVAGAALVPAGLAFSIIALGLVGLRYAGLDTAFGDQLAPTLGDWLQALNSHFPRP
jgi:hypothetical protein